MVGIIDAAKAMFSREGFDLSNFRQELLEKGKDSSLQTIRDEIIGMNIFNAVFVAVSYTHLDVYKRQGCGGSC